jgi:hypothetical protein
MVKRPPEFSAKKALRLAGLTGSLVLNGGAGRPNASRS